MKIVERKYNQFVVYDNNGKVLLMTTNKPMAMHVYKTGKVKYAKNPPKPKKTL